MIAVADADDAVAESLENNNTRTSAAVQIGPDFMVTALTGAVVCRRRHQHQRQRHDEESGRRPAPASVTSFYLSSNSTFDAGDLLLGSRGCRPWGQG